MSQGPRQPRGSNIDSLSMQYSVTYTPGFRLREISFPFRFSAHPSPLFGHWVELIQPWVTWSACASRSSAIVAANLSWWGHIFIPASIASLITLGITRRSACARWCGGSSESWANEDLHWRSYPTNTMYQVIRHMILWQISYFLLPRMSPSQRH